MAEGKGMTKSTPASNKKSAGPDPWEVRDAMHTMLRAGEITKDKKMLALVREEAKNHASKMRDVADQAGQLAKMGRISPKQMAKLGAR
jgi:hypothetical protein